MALIPLTKIGPEAAGNYEFQWTGPYLQAHLLSDVGKKRAHNEDSCLLCVPEDEAIARSHGMLFAVADGMGGANAGEFASRLALQTICEWYFGLPPANGITTLLRESVAQSNRRVFEEAESNTERRGMGTTLSAALVVGQYLYAAQVGDSRIYLQRPDCPLKQVTEDHSLVAEQLRSGMITAEEARTHSMKNLITRAIGIKDAVKTDLFSVKLQKGDTLLICSDGLCNMVNDEIVSRALGLSNLQGVARRLVGHALEGGGSDNITTVIIRITDVPPATQAELDATPVSIPRPRLITSLKRLFVRQTR